MFQHHIHPDGGDGSLTAVSETVGRAGRESGLLIGSGLTVGIERIPVESLYNSMNSSLHAEELLSRLGEVTDVMNP